MPAKRSPKRRARRVDAELPLLVNGKPGITRDLSASGMFLETDASYRVGKTINIALNLATPWGKVIFSCDGKIVRMGRHQRRIRVAVQFMNKRPIHQQRRNSIKPGQ